MEQRRHAGESQVAEEIGERPSMKQMGLVMKAATAMARRHVELRSWQSRLRAIDTTGWTTEQQIDWHLVRAEMNGLDFYIRVLKPWERVPAPRDDARLGR